MVGTWLAMFDLSVVGGARHALGAGSRASGVMPYWSAVLSVSFTSAGSRTLS